MWRSPGHFLRTARYYCFHFKVGPAKTSSFTANLEATLAKTEEFAKTILVDIPVFVPQ